MLTKTLAAIFSGLLLVSRTFAAEPQSDTYADRVEAATRYVEVADFRNMINDMVVQTAAEAPEIDRRKVIDFLKANIRTNYIENAAISVFTKHFTADELNALADFYGTARGKSILSKLGPCMGDIMPVMQNEMTRVIEQAKKEGL